MRSYYGLLVTVATLAGVVSCSSSDSSSADSGEVGALEVELTNAPADAACLRLTVDGGRTDVRSFPLTAGQNAVFRLKGLPVGTASIVGDAFGVACNKVSSSLEPTWYSEPVTIRIRSNQTSHVALAMIHNGRVSVGVDFDEDNAPKTPGNPAPGGGVFSSQSAYFVAVDPNVQIKAILTVGDSPNLKPDGTPYRMVGIPDGLGAFDNGDGTFTMLSNHELGASSGRPRAHGERGAFVSKWIIRKSDFAVLHGEDLMHRVATWNRTTSSFEAPRTGVAFGRFCSADLPAPTAFFDVESGLGFDGLLFMNGEETGDEGRGMAHGLDGTSWELPHTGKFSWENSVASPAPGVKTIVAGMDDSTPGQVYFYVGTKTASGSPVDMAGLTNGVLYGLRIPGVPSEPTAGIPTGPFELYSFGNVANMTGAQLDAASNANLVARMNRPEDGAWDPNAPGDYYFVTTASFNGLSRLWRLSFTDISQPELGGEIEMLLDGTEGHKMLDNMTLDQYGHVYLTEDVGGNARLGKIWRYDIASDTMTEIAQADPARFDAAAPGFITIDEEGSGIIDAADLLGPGWLLLDMQVHASAGDAELGEGGQFMALYDPAAAGGLP